MTHTWITISPGSPGTKGVLHTAGVGLERELAVFADGNTPIEIRAEGSAEFVIGSAHKHPHHLVLGPSSVHTSEEARRRGHARIIELADAPDVRAARHG